MTGDARGEAERIVSDYALRVQGEVEPDSIGWDDRYLSGAAEAYDRLVAALAAAIDVVEVRMDNYAQKTRPVEEAMRRNIEAHEELERAVSALRARAGEETG